MSGITLARPLQLRNKPVTRVENYCTTGLGGTAGRRLRGGLGGLRRRHGGRGREGEGQRIPGPQRDEPAERRHGTDAHGGGHVLHGGPGLRAEVRGGRGDHGRRAGLHRREEPPQRRPQPTGPVPPRDLQGDCVWPPPAWPAASASSTAPVSPTGPPPPSSCGRRTRYRYTDKPLYIKALSFAAGSGSGPHRPRLRLHALPRVRGGGGRRLRPGGHHRPAPAAGHGRGARLLHPDRARAHGGPRASPTRGTAWKEVLAGTFDLDGDLPVNPDGGLKSFGHPVGASGLRMFFECWLQLRGEATRGAPDRHHRPRPGPDPQPGRLPRRDGVVRLGGRHRARLTRVSRSALRAACTPWRAPRPPAGRRPCPPRR